MTDEQLARQLQQGNSQALAMLVECHYDRLLGYLYRLLGGNRNLAEDLVQETFIRVLRSIDRYTYPRPFKAWLYSIATNLARNHYDRADTRRVTGGDDEISQMASEDTSVEESLTHQVNVQQIIMALGALPEHQREVIILRYYEECSLAEIRDALGLPIGTVKSRLSIGLKRLKSLVPQEEIL